MVVSATKSQQKNNNKGLNTFRQAKNGPRKNQTRARLMTGKFAKTQENSTAPLLVAINYQHSAQQLLQITRMEM